MDGLTVLYIVLRSGTKPFADMLTPKLAGQFGLPASLAHGVLSVKNLTADFYGTVCNIVP